MGEQEPRQHARGLFSAQCVRRPRAMVPKHHNSNSIVEAQLTDRLKAIEKTQGGDVGVFIGPIVRPFDDEIREAIEGVIDRQDRLSFILETFGGYVDSARRIAKTLRHHYSHVDFIVPGHAMSAGTILVMSGDAILMDYYSVLGRLIPRFRAMAKRGLSLHWGISYNFNGS